MLTLRIYPLLVLILSASGLSAMRSDSFSIARTTIDLIIRNFSARTIKGSASHHIRFKQSTAGLTLDLRQLKVDSVLLDGLPTSYIRNGEKLNVDLDRLYQAGDSCDLKVYYSGIPASDPGGWGGFYFSGDYAFNLGVGFSVHPHSFGRAWFPCVDEFTMKTAYEFRIETDSNYTAACNGVLTGSSANGSSRIWQYSEPVPMSAYLVSVSVSRFSVLKSAYKGSASGFPIDLFCRPADTLKVSASFAKLPQAIAAFETAFGPQVFSKVGYNFVPFNAGAMEHAGNITYPLAFANGSADYEELMAHELSHHWWGNNVTCSSEGDMWLNEGWASYCEHFFTEQVYGKEAYKTSIGANHLNVLRFAHINDANIFSMVNIPKEHTYGNHVYKKGADVIHSLRSVVGDSVFFRACKAYQLAYRLGNAGTADMENVFADQGGGTRARSFFENWVYEKGFPHVIISKQIHSGNGPYRLTFHTLQKPRFTDKLYKNMPLEVFFFKDRGYYEKRVITINQANDSFAFDFDFKPVFVCVDYDGRLSDAISDRTVLVGSPGVYDLPEALSKLYVRRVSDSAMLRVEHHWVGPEKYRTRAPYMSDYRYYTLDGIWNDSLDMDLELSFDGRQGGPNSGTGYLDHTLIFKTEDSLTVLYRAFPGDHWREWKDLQFSAGSKNDKQGKVIIKHALRGDYVFAMYDKSLALGGIQDGKTRSFRLCPNPGSTAVKLLFDLEEAATVAVYDKQGVCVYSWLKPYSVKEATLDTSQYASGFYTVRFSGAGFDHSLKLLVQH